jgi:hypothetical protein
MAIDRRRHLLRLASSRHRKAAPGREWDWDDDLVKQHAARPEGDEAAIPTAGQRTHGSRSDTGSMGYSRPSQPANAPTASFTPAMRRANREML